LYALAQENRLEEIRVAGRVIQGFFIGGGRLVPAPVPASVPKPAPVQRFAARPQGAMPGPPPPAFARAGGQALQQRPAPGRPPLAHGVAAHAHRGGANPVTGTVQRFGGEGSFAIDPAQIGLVRNGGAPLPQALLAKMEAALGADFSGVRVHVGGQAARIGALAFTTGNDLYFAPGQYQPDSARGQQLIGHELAHVIQQRQGRVRAPAHGVAVVQDRALEAEADRLGMRAAASAARTPVQAKHAPGAFVRGAHHPQAVLQRMKRRNEDDGETPDAKRKRLNAVTFTHHNMNFTEFGTVNQSFLTGNAKRPKAKFFTIKQSQKKMTVPTTKEIRYTTTDKIHGFVKVNGLVVNYGNNQAGKETLDFLDMGYKYQNGDLNIEEKPMHKDNPHAEDWSISGFRTEFEKSGYKSKKNGLAKWLSAQGMPVTRNTGRLNTHVISVWINFSSCLGCATTITKFHDWLNGQLAGNFLLRVKFLRPHDLRADSSGIGKNAEDFVSSIARLRGKGIYVRMQSERSAERNLGRKFTDEEKKFPIAVNHPGVRKTLTPDQYKYLTQSWTEMGINRK
jgi:hypothetical protein